MSQEGAIAGSADATGHPTSIKAPQPVAQLARTETFHDPNMKEVELGTSDLAQLFAVICCPFTYFPSFWIQNPREESIVLHFGKVTAKVSTPGCHYHPLVGREIRSIATVQFCASIPRQKVTDKTGNPVNVSAVITYRFVHPTRALLNVQAPHEYVTTQAMSVLKSVVSQFSYEELKTESADINMRVLIKLQPRVQTAGAVVLSCMLDELNYAPEIASHMLKKQQARALIEARHLLVRGSVGISTAAVNDLKKVGVHVSDKDRARLISSIIIVTAGDTAAQPVLQI